MCVALVAHLLRVQEIWKVAVLKTDGTQPWSGPLKMYMECKESKGPILTQSHLSDCFLMHIWKIIYKF
jgi:hypothetical protein